jgi:hypothetical protein
MANIRVLDSKGYEMEDPALCELKGKEESKEWRGHLVSRGKSRDGRYEFQLKEGHDWFLAGLLAFPTGGLSLIVNAFMIYINRVNTAKAYTNCGLGSLPVDRKELKLRDLKLVELNQVFIPPPLVVMSWQEALKSPPDARITRLQLSGCPQPSKENSEDLDKIIGKFENLTEFHFDGDREFMRENLLFLANTYPQLNSVYHENDLCLVRYKDELCLCVEGIKVSGLQLIPNGVKRLWFNIQDLTTDEVRMIFRQHPHIMEVGYLHCHDHTKGLEGILKPILAVFITSITFGVVGYDEDRTYTRILVERKQVDKT